MELAFFVLLGVPGVIFGTLYILFVKAPMPGRGASAVGREDELAAVR